MLAVIIAIAVAIAAGGIALWWFLLRRAPARGKGGARGHSLLDFLVRAQSAGFSIKESLALIKLARRFGLPDPNGLLMTQASLDNGLRLILRSAARAGGLGDPAFAALLARVFDYRMDVEKNRPRYRKGLESTRMVAAGQMLKILVPAVGVFQVKVIDNFRPYMTVEQPTGKQAPVGHKWKDQRLDVYFWRKGDALYHFETVVLNDPAQATLQPVLQLAHSETLTRTQKRNSIRVKVMKVGRILPLAGREDADDLWDPSAGFQCKVTDISETGSAVLVRGKVQAGRMVKLLVELGGLPVVMCGEIKGATLNPRYNVSLLHIEAAPGLSPVMAIRVQAFVLGLVTDEAPLEVSAAGEGLGHEMGPTDIKEGLDSLPGSPVSPPDLPPVDGLDHPDAVGGTTSAPGQEPNLPADDDGSMFKEPPRH